MSFTGAWGRLPAMLVQVVPPSVFFNTYGNGLPARYPEKVAYPTSELTGSNVTSVTQVPGTSESVTCVQLVPRLALNQSRPSSVPANNRLESVLAAATVVTVPNG